MRTFIPLLLLLSVTAASGQTSRVYAPGEWRLKLGLPYLNSFQLRPQDETPKSRTGFIGFEGGLEHQLTENTFLALGATILGAARIPFGVMDIEGEADRYTSISMAVTHNRTVGRFSVGYGIGWARNTWEYTRSFVPDSIPPTRELVSRTSTNVGFTLNTYYGLGRAFNIGLIYRPYLLKLQPQVIWQYEHVLSLDLLWRIRFAAPRRITTETR